MNYWKNISRENIKIDTSFYRHNSITSKLKQTVATGSCLFSAYIRENVWWSKLGYCSRKEIFPKFHNFAVKASLQSTICNLTSRNERHPKRAKMWFVINICPPWEEKRANLRGNWSPSGIIAQNWIKKNHPRGQPSQTGRHSPHSQPSATPVPPT